MHIIKKLAYKQLTTLHFKTHFAYNSLMTITQRTCQISKDRWLCSRKWNWLCVSCRLFVFSQRFISVYLDSCPVLILHPCVLSHLLVVCKVSQLVSTVLHTCRTSLYVFVIFLRLLNIIYFSTCCNIILNISKFITVV